MTDKNEKLCITDAMKAKIDQLKTLVVRNEDELRAASYVVGTGVACATIGFIAGRINGWCSGVDVGVTIGNKMGKAEATAEIAEKILLAVIDEESNENVK